MYKYGFTEAAFNFQDNNFGKGGVGGDPVEMEVQNGEDTDNADFAVRVVALTVLITIAHPLPWFIPDQTPPE